MICPHCGRTIREEDQNLMHRDPDAEVDALRWIVAVVCAAIFLIVFIALGA